MRYRPELWLGSPCPLGATPTDEGINFAVFSEHATSMNVCLFDSIDAPAEHIRINMTEQTDQVWHVFVPGLKAVQLYGFRPMDDMTLPAGSAFNESKLLLDPSGCLVGTR